MNDQTMEATLEAVELAARRAALRSPPTMQRMFYAMADELAKITRERKQHPSSPTPNQYPSPSIQNPEKCAAMNVADAIVAWLDKEHEVDDFIECLNEAALNKWPSKFKSDKFK